MALTVHRKYFDMTGSESPAAEQQASRIVYGTQFDLRAVRREGGVFISWNRDNYAVQSAVSGLLLIRDGNENTAIPMVSDQIRFGQYFVSPRSDSVQISLELVNASNQRVQDAAGLSMSNTPAPPMTAKINSNPVRNVATPPLVIPPRQQEANSRARQGTPAPSTSVQSPPPRVEATHRPPEPAKPEPVTRAATGPAEAPPAVSTSRPPTEQLANATLPPVQEQPVPQSATPVAQVAKPNPEALAPLNPVRADFRETPPQSSQETASLLPKVTQAVPVSQAPIIIPSALKASIDRQSVEVGVTAFVDAGGRVKSVRPAGGMSPLQANLFTIARIAVLNWRFRPARVGDKPVDSEFTIHFRFGGNGR